MINNWAKLSVRSLGLARLSRHFAQLPHINWKEVMRIPKTDMLRDDLWYDHEKGEHFEVVVQAIRENPNREFNAKAVAYFLYNMSIINVQEGIIADLIERYVTRFRGDYVGRLSFGALAGGLRLNYKPMLLRIFAEDFINQADNLGRCLLTKVLMNMCTLTRHFRSTQACLSRRDWR